MTAAGHGTTSAPGTLACPHCRAPVAVPLAGFFPTRRTAAICANCGGAVRLPVAAVLLGLAVLLVLIALGLTALRALGWNRPETIAGVLGLGVAFLLLAWLATHLASRLCRAMVGRLDP